MFSLKHKRVAVIGACGTVGAKIIERLLNGDDVPDQVIGLDNHEQSIFEFSNLYAANRNVDFLFLDIRDYSDVRSRISGVDVVIHCAAMKHVGVCERSPRQAIETNVLGVQNVINACVDRKVSRLLFTSSDKAVNPTNVMGTSKLMGERLITAASSLSQDTICASTRFGNVLGSSGSVLPIFYSQLLAGKPISVTDINMTRFIMSIEQAADLVLESLYEMKGGEVFVTKMPVVNILKLGEALWSLMRQRGLSISGTFEYDIIGVKPGEKLYEELMTDEETRRTVELSKYFAVLPAFRGFFHDVKYSYNQVISEQITNPYVSSQEPELDIQAIMNFIEDGGLLDDLTGTSQISRNWPGDR